MGNSLSAGIRALQRWFGLARKNPRTTAVGIVAMVTGAKLIWTGQLEEGIVAALTGAGLFVAPDAVTVSRQDDRLNGTKGPDVPAGE